MTEASCNFVWMQTAHFWSNKFVFLNRTFAQYWNQGNLTSIQLLILIENRQRFAFWDFAWIQLETVHELRTSADHNHHITPLYYMNSWNTHRICYQCICCWINVAQLNMLDTREWTNDLLVTSLSHWLNLFLIMSETKMIDAYRSNDLIIDWCIRRGVSGLSFEYGCFAIPLSPRCSWKSDAFWKIDGNLDSWSKLTLSIPFFTLTFKKTRGSREDKKVENEEGHRNRRIDLFQ